MKLTPLLRRLTIKDKDAELVDFEPNWAQKELIAEVERQHDAGLPVRIIILKARQVGASTCTQGILFCWAWLFSHAQLLTIAHEEDPAENLHGMTDTFWENFPFKMLDKAKHLSRKRFSLEIQGSGTRVATAKNVKTGRSFTYQGVHASEVAFYHDPKTLMTGLKQTIPQRHGTIIILESTPNGMGNYFYDQWINAKEGLSAYVPLFFPWWRHPEYRASTLNLPVTMLHRDDDETELAKLMADGGLGEDEINDRLVWRRYTITNELDGDTDKFRQEYPSDDEECFLAAGSNQFPLDQLKVVYQRDTTYAQGRLENDASSPSGVIFQEDRSGPLKLYRMPAGTTVNGDRAIPGQNGNYFIGGDPKRNPTKGDYACAQVIRRENYEQVATWHGRIDPMLFAKELDKLGRFFNTAVLAPEATGPGYATVGALQHMAYPNIFMQRYNFNVTGAMPNDWGWHSNVTSKEYAIGHLRKLVRERQVKVHDAGTYAEMKIYVNLPVIGFGPASAADPNERYDDRVMALAIACAASHLDGGVYPETGRSEVEDWDVADQEWG